jgi:hypothetical protein
MKAKDFTKEQLETYLDIMYLERVDRNQFDERLSKSNVDLSGFQVITSREIRETINGIH